jgi:tripartite-type tricarboxylate transporter receptor subunit TctC
MKWVPYGGGAAKLRAMLAGEAEVDMLLESLIRDPLKQGTVRALAVASTERLSNLPDVPTFKELGFDVVDGLTVAIWAPAGPPPDRVATLREGLMKIRNDPEYQALYAKLGQDIKGFISGADYDAEWNKTWAEGQSLLKAVTQ